jgi:hypothetical protein
MARKIGLGKKILFSTIACGIFFAFLELAVSTVAWASGWDTSYWLFEDSGRTVRFDPVRGYRLGPTPSRFLRSTNGRLEYVGTARGNNQGFADRDDFGPRRMAPGRRRFVVMGDSFTEGQFLGQNWPDRAEDLFRGRGEAVEFLNMAVSGGGLANWWSILTKLVDAEGYEVDGVIFSVFAGDLRRKFSAWDHTVGNHPLFGRADRWEPETYPATFAEARRFLQPHPSVILSSQEFERSLQGHWPRAIARPFRPFLLTQIWRTLRYRRGEANQPEEMASDPVRDRLISEIGRTLAARRLPALVIHIPDRPGLLDPDGARWQKREAEEFARAIGAKFLDGGRLFEGLSTAEIKGLFLPHDGHWNQAGSDRFAEFVASNLDLLAPASMPPTR